MQFHDINYSTFICPFKSGKWEKRRKKKLKSEYLENENSFSLIYAPFDS